MKKDRKISRDEIVNIIRDEIMTTKEVLEYLDISKPRLTTLNHNEVLKPIKKGLYLRCDVEKRKEEQQELRAKYYKR